MRLYPAFQRVEVERPALAGDFTASRKNGERRNATDVEAGGELWLGLGVDLGETGVGFKVNSRLVEGRRHHAARPAPWRPEIDDDRQVVPCQMAVKTGAAQFQRFPGEQRLLALAAMRRVAQLGGWDALVPDNLHGAI